jgi:hypothetical protein
METSIRIIDYHLKERIQGQNSKITLTGSTPHCKIKPVNQTVPEKVALI